MSKKLTLILSMVLFVACSAQAQHVEKKFGKGLNFYGKDSSFHVKFGFRFQSLYQAEWDVTNDELGNINSLDDKFLTRRSRLKFNGYAFSPKLKWKLELALSNRDISSGAITPEQSNASNIVLDAYADWNFYKGFSIKMGQFKLPGNIERVVSSANLQLVDRSLLNSKFNVDRDMGFQLTGKQKVDGTKLVFKEKVALTQGLGRNITSGTTGGYNYTFRGEVYPFGEFKKGKDDYVGSALVYYERPRLMLGAAYNINENAIRSKQGWGGSFIADGNGDYVGKQLNTLFLDGAFKYKRLSVMGEFAAARTSDDDGRLFDAANNVVGQFNTGTAFNLQAGYMLNKRVSTMTGNLELVGRYTTVDYYQNNDEDQFTIGVNRFVSGHQLKIQADMTYRAIDGKDDGLMFRLQTDVHF